MRRFVERQAVHRDECGQMAIAMVLSLLIVFVFFALAFDAGLWYFDHRTAQNQAEAAALAAAQELPQVNASLAPDETGPATDVVNEWLSKNNATPCAPSCVTYTDRNDDSRIDTIRVEVERDSDGVFSSLSGIDFVTISGAATSTVGRAKVANVMPWAVVPPDPNCNPDPVANDTCSSGDLDGDGQILEASGECEGPFFNPDGTPNCPWGMNLDDLIAFKDGGGGNTGIIDACGGGAAGYKDCLAGQDVSGFFEAGTEVVVGLQGGNLGQNTDNGLSGRFAEEDPGWNCDVASDPDAAALGYDPDGKQEGYDLWADPTSSTYDGSCAHRLVVIPILASMPDQGGGSSTLTVLGVATFGIASWNREDASKSAWGRVDKACASQQGGQPPPDEFECGMVWGYIYADVIPPEFLLQQIDNEGDNPLGPLLIALID